MASANLLFWIILGICGQLLIWLGFVFWKQRQHYRALSVSADREPAPAKNAWKGSRRFKVVQKVREDANGSICSFYLHPEDGQPLPPFKPGQFLTFKLALPSVAGAPKPLTRCYSLSDAPNAEGYRVSIKRVSAPAGAALPAGRGSNYFHDHVQVGTSLDVLAPSGQFYIDESSAPVVLIGGGIGITPMLSMLNWALANQADREVWLFYAVRDSSELVMHAYLKGLAKQHPNFKVRFCFSAPGPADLLSEDCREGRIDVSLLRTELPLKPYHFYICGPTPMMESLVSALEAWGVPEPRIHFEAFGPASVKRAAKGSGAPAPGEKVSVSFAKTGTQHDWDSTSPSLLDFAEARGVQVESSCRSGNCGSCQTRLRSGEVQYIQAPGLDVEPGHCLPCVCAPKTNLILEA